MYSQAEQRLKDLIFAVEEGVPFDFQRSTTMSGEPSSCGGEAKKYNDPSWLAVYSMKPAEFGPGVKIF